MPTAWFAGRSLPNRGNLDAPIAFLFERNEEKKVSEVHKYADDIVDNPDLLDRAVDHAEEHPICRIDLRDRGRADSKRRMPGWCYGLIVTGQSEDGMFIGNEEIEWNPYCPIRLAMMQAKKPAAR